MFLSLLVYDIGVMLTLKMSGAQNYNFFFSFPYKNHLKQIENTYKYGKIHYGIIGSGDIWNSECDWLIKLNEKYGILCEEMEGIAVYTIANQYKIPAIDIRVISDNELLKEEYDRNISLKGQEFIMNLLREIF